METNVLTNQHEKPNEKLVFSIIGDKRIYWQTIMNYLYNNQTNISEEWIYYHDVNSWFLRTLKKKKTIFWIIVLSGTFKVTFWFGDKAEPLIEQSNLCESIKNEFKNAKRYAIGRNVSVKITNQTDVDEVVKLIEIKLKMK